MLYEWVRLFVREMSWSGVAVSWLYLLKDHWPLKRRVLEWRPRLGIFGRHPVRWTVDLEKLAGSDWMRQSHRLPHPVWTSRLVLWRKLKETYIRSINQPIAVVSNRLIDWLPNKFNITEKNLHLKCICNVQCRNHTHELFVLWNWDFELITLTIILKIFEEPLTNIVIRDYINWIFTYLF